MNTPHRRLFQRLGAAALSGLIITALAPSALAAPAGERATHGDMEPSAVADSQPESGTVAQEETDDTGRETPEATGTGALPEASPETQDELNATVYEFPGTEGPTRIHVLTIGSADAIMLESRGVFAMVDSAEGIGAPDGSDPRYPLREGIVPAHVGDTNRVLRYMIDHGVTSSNLAFYLGTHAHSDHIAAEVGEVDMLKAGHHGAESSNSVPFMAALHPGAIIQTGAASHSPDRLSFLVLHGDTKWFPMGNIWDSMNVPALVCVFADDEIQYDGVAGAQWGHEYESETPRAWWFQAGRPAATTGWWDGPSGNRYYFDGSASALANQWAVIDGVTYHFDATGVLDATASTLTGSGVAGSFAASSWWYVLLGAALTALAGAGIAIAGRAGGS